PKCTILAFLHHPVQSHCPSIPPPGSPVRFQLSCHTCHLHPAVPYRYLPPSCATQCTHYHHPPAPCRLLPEFHVPLTSAESAKDGINWYRIHSVVS
ncbi:hypothetical protein M405DRAFT_807812, partial [Rhizopogon salebrosus TDB-379]